VGSDSKDGAQMAVVPDPRTPYSGPPSSILDTASGTLRVIAALLGTILLIWIFVGIGGATDSARLTDSVDPDAVPLVAMQAVGPAPIATP
jgi:hypothetical protein